MPTGKGNPLRKGKATKSKANKGVRNTGSRVGNPLTKKGKKRSK